MSCNTDSNDFLGNGNLHQFIETMFPGPYTAYSGRLMGGDYYKRDEVIALLKIDQSYNG